MKKALDRTRHFIDPPIYQPPMKRLKKLGPYLAGILWVLMMGGFVLYLLTLP
jgi:hypothetical protein